MANDTKTAFLRKLASRYGVVRKLERSQSLYDIRKGAARVYIRYSKVHNRNRTFYGLRREDLQQLEGHPSFICFLWDDQREPLLIPFSEYEDVFYSTSPASDGQYKAMVFLRDDGAELYIAKAGRFNAEGNFGWDQLEALITSGKLGTVPEFSHWQMQTLLGAIGAAKTYHIWVPPSNRDRLDWSLAARFECTNFMPYLFEEPAKSILQEVDVVWLERGSNDVRALFEVEHSTPIYSALLRFNDIHLAAPRLRPTFSIVANDARRDLFVRQLNRPTFQASGLSDLCTFLEYADVFGWYRRMTEK